MNEENKQLKDENDKVKVAIAQQQLIIEQQQATNAQQQVSIQQLQLSAKQSLLTGTIVENCTNITMLTLLQPWQEERWLGVSRLSMRKFWGLLPQHVPMNVVLVCFQLSLCLLWTLIHLIVSSFLLLHCHLFSLISCCDSPFACLCHCSNDRHSVFPVFSKYISAQFDLFGELIGGYLSVQDIKPNCRLLFVLWTLLIHLQHHHSSWWLWLQPLPALALPVQSCGTEKWLIQAITLTPLLGLTQPQFMATTSKLKTHAKACQGTSLMRNANRPVCQI